MKLLFDLLPVVVFYLAYWIASHVGISPEHANAWLGMFTRSGNEVVVAQAPILVATLATIVATAAQVAWLLVRRQRVPASLWVSFAIVAVLGGATVWLQDETFIKWKPTGLYLVFALGLAIARYGVGRNVVRSALEAQVELAPAEWDRLNLAWVAFFVAMAILNLIVAYSVSTDMWVNFKLFGSTGLLILFIVGTTFWVMRHAPPEGDRSAPGSGAD